MWKTSHFWRLGLAVLIVGLSAIFTEPASAQWQSNWKSCFNFAEGFVDPTRYSGPPNIDGTVAGDLGWTRAWRYVFHNGTPIHDVAAQVARSNDNQFLFLSFEVNNDRALNATDTIVVAFDTGSGSPSKKLLEIKPLINGGVRLGPDPDNPTGPQISTPQINFYTANALPFGGSGVTPASTRARTTTSGSGTNWSWVVELKLSRGDLGIPATGTFGLYFNVLVSQGTGVGPTALLNEYAWPVPLSGEELLGDPTALPAVNRWGTATADPAVACNGVYLTTNDIGTTNNPPTKLVLGQQNTIRATVHNSSLDASGNPKQARQIYAKFKYATFGMSQVWNDILADAGSKNPTDPMDITTTGMLETKWTVPTGDPRFPDGGKTCILAELDTKAPVPPAGSDDWTTIFINKSAWNNFHYSTSSRVDAAPVIDSRGWEKLPRGQKHQVELLVMSRIDKIDRDLASRSANEGSAEYSVGQVARVRDPWSQLSRMVRFPVERNESFKEYATALLKENVNVSQMVYLMHGCRRSGKFIKIDQIDHEICERVGSFGFGLRHASISPIINWLTEIVGANPLGKDMTHLQMSLDQETQTKLKMVFTAVDQDQRGKSCSCFNLSCWIKRIWP